MTTGKLATLDAKSTPQLFQASQFTGVQSSATLLAAVADGFYRIFLVDINSAATTGIVTLTFAGAAQPVNAAMAFAMRSCTVCAPPTPVRFMSSENSMRSPPRDLQ